MLTFHCHHHCGHPFLSSQKVHKAINLIYSSKLFLLISCVLSGLISTGMKLVVLKEVITGKINLSLFSSSSSLSGHVLTEVCSSPSKANDNYKSKLVTTLSR